MVGAGWREPIVELVILAVGRMKAGPERELFERYSSRCVKSGRELHLHGPKLVEIPESRARDAQTRKNEESQQIQRLSVGNSKLVLLDERGKDLTSKEFARLICDQQDQGVGQLCFALGGPDGHGDALKEATDITIRFGRLTWPHQFARIMLAEQLYRVTTVLSGHPYHRE